MMKEFKDTIEKYISLSIKSGNKVSSISSNLEKLEYYIKYEIDQDKNGFLMQEKNISNNNVPQRGNEII